MLITQAQALMLQIVEMTSVNNFNGSKIVADLRSHVDLWQSAYFTSLGIQILPEGNRLLEGSRHDLISLRDLPQGHFQFDTLLFVPAVDRHDDLFELVSTWNADLVEWIDLKESARVVGGKRSALQLSSDPMKTILYAWWD